MVNGKDPAAPVPTCPKWTLADLVDHVGSTQRMVALVPAPVRRDERFELWIDHMNWVID